MVHVYVMSAFSKDNKGGNKAGVVFPHWQWQQLSFLHFVS